MHSDPEITHFLSQMEAALIALDIELYRFELNYFGKANFNPNQPRVPAGNPDGGQWTDGGGGSRTLIGGSGEDEIEAEKPKYPDSIEEVYPENYIGALGAGRALISRRVGRSVAEWTFGPHKSPTKWANQMKKRGWTEEEITQTIAKGKKFPAKNVTVKPHRKAVRYQDPKTGKFVVIDKKTGELLQISDKYNPDFKPPVR